jgi:hypothetical protein
MSDTQDFVRHSLEGNAVEAQDTFHNLMKARIAAKLDQTRQTTAAALFAEPEVNNDDEDSSSES